MIVFCKRSIVLKMKKINNKISTKTMFLNVYFCASQQNPYFLF